jgi:tight adherence protein C
MTLGIIKPIALLLFCGAVAVLVYSLLPRDVSFNLSGKKDDDFETQEDSKFILIFQPFYRIFFPLIDRLPFRNYKATLKKYIVTAGLERDVSANDMIGFQVTVMFIFIFCGSILFDTWLYILLVGLVGLIYPYLWIFEKKKQRQEKIRLSMPDVVDMLSLTVEAGLAFSAAVQKVCDIYKHDNDPFVVELYLMDQNIKLGRSREEALKLMAERVDLLELDSFCSILIQANQMGSSISEVLKSQADRMRSERFMKAEKVGAQASQKLLFPMMIFIFPIIFIIIFGPYVVQFILGR